MNSKAFCDSAFGTIEMYIINFQPVLSLHGNRVNVWYV